MSKIRMKSSTGVPVRKSNSCTSNLRLMGTKWYDDMYRRKGIILRNPRLRRKIYK